MTIQKICVEIFIQIDQGSMLKKAQSLVDVVPIFGNQKCLVTHVVLCHSLSLILGLQRSQCGSVGG